MRLVAAFFALCASVVPSHGLAQDVARDEALREAEGAEARGDAVAAYRAAERVMARAEGLPEETRARLHALHRRLAAQVSELVVRVEAPGARVFVDDRETSPGRPLLVTRDAHRIRVEAPDRSPVSRYVVLDAPHVELVIELRAPEEATPAWPGPPRDARRIGLGVLALVGALISAGAASAATRYTDINGDGLRLQHARQPASRPRRPTLGEQRRARREARRNWRRRATR